MSSYAIYRPKGKAKEYSEWACNFYVGCSNQCAYCYLRKGRGAKILGGNVPTLKKCFRDESHALDIFERELNANLPELRKHGLFFSFSTDPMIRETKRLTIEAVKICNRNNVPVSVLTKEAGYVYLLGLSYDSEIDKRLIAIGFTLTGHDEQEPKASKNEQRILAMEFCKKAGYRTFASIEPIIDFDSSYNMIEATAGFCDIYKIGLESWSKYNRDDALAFYVDVSVFLSSGNKSKVYFKNLFLKLINIGRKDNNERFPCAVDSDYNMFNN